MRESTKKEVFSYIKIISLAVLLVFICRQFLYTPTTVHGESMEPTFEDKNRVIVSKISQIERFDLVVFKAPDEVNEHYIKRVIGVSGDQVEMRDGVLFINGEEFEEPYVKRNDDRLVSNDFTLEELTGNTTVPEGSFFVLGDNRLNSKDSRDFGFISDESVIGEVKFQYYPFNKISIPN